VFSVLYRSYVRPVCPFCSHSFTGQLSSLTLDSVTASVECMVNIIQLCDDVNVMHLMLIPGLSFKAI